MPRAKTEKANAPRGSIQCSICQTVISNKTDMPRHMKLHAPNKAKLMHRCPYPDCKFQNLQKSNVETHIRTHTKAKTECCPDCDFATVDPGSLTRHRKRLHQYTPHPRRSRQQTKDSIQEAGPSKEPSSGLDEVDETLQRRVATTSNSQQPMSRDQGNPLPLPAQEKQPQRRTKLPPIPSSSQSAPLYPNQPDRTRSSFGQRLPKYDPQPPHLTQLPSLSSMGEFRLFRDSNSLSPPPNASSSASTSSSSSSSTTMNFATSSPPYPPRAGILPPVILPPLSPPVNSRRHAPEHSRTSQGQLRR